MSQADDILEYLREHPEGITPLEALDRFGCMRLAARVSDLRRAGHDVVAVNERHAGGTHARYRLGDDDRRLIRTVAEWDEYAASHHQRVGHREPVIGCMWCVRIQEEASRWEVDPDAEPKTVAAPTLWDAA